MSSADFTDNSSLTPPPSGRHFPPIPQLGEEEKVYGKRAHSAEKAGDVFGASANKVAQYVTLGLDPALDWPAKLRYLEHALKKHAAPKPPIDEEIFAFYQRLAEFVKQHTGAEALKLVFREDAELEARKQTKKEPIFKLRSDAAAFFRQFLPSGERPDWFTDDDFAQLITLRNKWA